MRLLLAVLLLWPALAAAEPIAPNAIRVIDADTINVHGSADPNTRLVGFDTPEISNLACVGERQRERERDLGQTAKARLQQLVNAGGLDFMFVVCNCPPQTLGTPDCNWGRTCGTLQSFGRDVGAILIAEGLADPLICRGTRCPEATRSWCTR